jgi:hypothetical protein
VTGGTFVVIDLSVIILYTTGTPGAIKSRAGNDAFKIPYFAEASMSG